MHCTRCGTTLPDGSRFCSACGQDLHATPVRQLATGQMSESDLVVAALADEYEQFEELGRGGMAIVYRARERQLERDVAVKVLPVSLTFDQEFVERFQREARTAAQLEHPNIIPIYRVGRIGQVIYFVMKYLRGGCLSDILREHGTLRPAEIRRLLLEAGAALGYAAQQDVVHRDIKPDNIMFDEFGRVVLTDFGIAKAASKQRLTSTGTSIGTPHYMSPEQARAQPTDGRTDIYSLGVVAYQCLTGAVPFDGDDAFQIGFKHISEPPPQPRLVNADERRLYAVIERMLAKDPERRFQNCEEMTQALQGGEIAGSVVRAGTAAGPPVVLMPGETPVTPPPTTTVTPVMPPPLPPPGEARTGTRGSPDGIPDERRGIANRSAATQGRRSPMPGGVVMVLNAPGVAGWWWYQQRSAVTTPPGIGKDSAAALAGRYVDSIRKLAADTARPDTTHPAASRRDTAAARPPAAPAVAAAPSRDSGAIRIRDLPVGSEVLIDEARAMSAITRLPVGRHVVAISAPQHEFFAETVAVRRNDTLLLTPGLTRIGAPLTRREARREVAQELRAGGDPCLPGPQWDGTQCFDVRPRPLSTPYVALPPGVHRVARPTEFWVFVGLSGASEEIRLLRSSGTPAFDRAARAIATALEWTPAQKNGAAVGAWTQMVFPPAPE